jgi:light-regulated signal transduction histidine kinase (bacteriophytochrome)
VHEVIDDLQARIESAHGRVDVGELPTIDADAAQMRQLFQNLIANGLRFRRDGHPPVVRVYGRVAHNAAPESEVPSHGQVCEIVVQDNGIGFDPKYADRIFGMFQRLHGRDEYEGTGVGLAICRKIAQRHGGSIEAASTPGEGARFTVALPVS